eukprot:NODE_13_length_54415_cov_0.522424.p38 type:complete len:140 gc:universal NODE_13_length_54415_cov_0.522424:18920-19339(+)
MIPGALPENLEDFDNSDTANEIIHFVIYCFIYLIMSIKHIYNHHNLIHNRTMERLHPTIVRPVSNSTRKHSIQTLVNTESSEDSSVKTASYDNIPETVKLQHLILEKNDQIRNLESRLENLTTARKTSIRNMRYIFKKE